MLKLFESWFERHNYSNALQPLLTFYADETYKPFFHMLCNRGLWFLFELIIKHFCTIHTLSTFITSLTTFYRRFHNVLKVFIPFVEGLHCSKCSFFVRSYFVLRNQTIYRGIGQCFKPFFLAKFHLSCKN